MIGLFPSDAIAVSTDGDLCAVVVETTAHVSPSRGLLESPYPGRMASMTIRGRAATTGAADFDRYSTATEVRPYDQGLIAVVWPAVQFEEVAWVHDEVFLTLQALPGHLPAWMGIHDDRHVMGWVVLP